MTIDWITNLLSATPETKTYPTDGIKEEAVAVHFMAETLREIYNLAHSNAPDAKRKMYYQINRFELLTGRSIAKPAAEIVQIDEKKKPPESHIQRVRRTVDFLEAKKDEIRNSRKEDFPNYLNAPGNGDQVSKMEPAKTKIEEMIKLFNTEVKIWNGKLPNLLKLKARYQRQFIADRKTLTPESVREIKRDTGLTAKKIIDSFGAHDKHQEDLKDKKKHLDEGVLKAYAAFAAFETQIKRAIDAYKYGGVAGKETLGNWNPIPYNPNLKDVPFTTLSTLKTVDEVAKELAAKVRLPNKPAAAKKPAAKVKVYKSPAEQDAPMYARPAAALKPAAASAKTTAPAKEKKT